MIKYIKDFLDDISEDALLVNGIWIIFFLSLIFFSINSNPEDKADPKDNYFIYVVDADKYRHKSASGIETIDNETMIRDAKKAMVEQNPGRLYEGIKIYIRE